MKKQVELQNLTEKICKKCNKTQSIEMFHNKYDTKDGLQTNCKICVNAIKREKRKEKEY